MNQIDDSFKKDIDSLIEYLFLYDGDPEVEKSRDRLATFIEGIVKDSSLTPVEASVLMSRIFSLSQVCTSITILAERRDLPMHQLGVYFRKKLRERLHTFILSDLHKASELNK